MWCHYCDKNNHNTADCRAIAKFKQQKNNKAQFEAKADHLLKSEMVLARLSTAGMIMNISKSKFFAEHIEYLGYCITRQGIQPIRNKVEAILNIKAPKTRKEDRTTPVYWYSQHYRDMWFRRSELLSRFH
jgi:hypothetical protein